MKRSFVLAVFFALYLLRSSAPARAEDVPLWTWMAGEIPSDSNKKGHFGTRGVPSPDNYPPILIDPNLVADPQGRLWLFGGQGVVGIEMRNNLWRYDPAAGWAWMTGPNTPNSIGNYGTLGEETPGAAPGARWHAAAWTDNLGRIWVFGGMGYATGSVLNGDLGDTWRYDPSTKYWAWMNGPSSLSSPGVFGTQGIEAPANSPPARTGATTWGGCAARLWLFGGATDSGHIDDLWRLNTVSGQWTWVKGSSQAGQSTVWGEKGVEAPGNTPGARVYATGWTDPAGRLWLFGGMGSSDFNQYADHERSVALQSGYGKLGLDQRPAANERA